MIVPPWVELASWVKVSESPSGSVPASVMLDAVSSVPETAPAPVWSVASPGPGRYYFRYRSIEPDAYVTPFSDKLVIDVPRDLTGLWWLVPFVAFGLAL